MDLRTVFDADTQSTDLVLDGMQLAEDDGLETAVVISLFTDRRADADEPLPDHTDRRRGWFGDVYSTPEGDAIGSLLWLLSREKRTDQTLQRAREYARAALAWLIADGVARAIDVEASWNSEGVLVLDVAIARADAPTSRFRFESFWNPANGV